MTTIEIDITPEQWAAALKRIRAEEHIEIPDGQTSGEIKETVKMFWHIDLTWSYNGRVFKVIILKKPPVDDAVIESTIRNWFAQGATA